MKAIFIICLCLDNLLRVESAMMKPADSTMMKPVDSAMMKPAEMLDKTFGPMLKSQSCVFYNANDIEGCKFSSRWMVIKGGYPGRIRPDKCKSPDVNGSLSCGNRLKWQNVTNDLLTMEMNAFISTCKGFCPSKEYCFSLTIYNEDCSPPLNTVASDNMNLFVLACFNGKFVTSHYH